MPPVDSEPPSNPTNVAWYQPSLKPSQLSPATASLLEDYSYIPRADIDAHVTAIRDKAWSLFPYPCIGQWRFLDLSIAQQPVYARVLALLKEGCDDGSDVDDDDEKKTSGTSKVKTERKKLLDLGCCFAQDIRRLIHDGTPADSLYACDLKPEFLDLGFDLFKDRETCKAHFFAADVLHDGGEEGSETNPLAALQRKIDVVYAASFFHLFSWDNQVKIAEKVVRLLRPREGSLVFGRHTAAVRAGEVERTIKPVEGAKSVWRHDVESFTRLWGMVGQKTGSRWGVWAEMYETEHTASHWAGEGMRMMRFEVTRLE